MNAPASVPAAAAPPIVRPHEPAGGPFDEALRLRLARARDDATNALLGGRNAEGTWTGELSPSALSTATAVTALALCARADASASTQLSPLIARGVAWLIAHQNADGGWGDTPASVSNISTTTLVWAALGFCDDLGRGRLTPLGNDVERRGQATPPYIAAAEAWLTRAAGSLEPASLVAAIERRYGEDRTFSIPILTMCALCGRLGADANAWRRVRQLPFELAALPQRWFGALQLPVVSYALPALIAIGQVRHARRPTRNPVLRALRHRCRQPTLDKLTTLQPANGGFLEATPLTSFVVMSLVAAGHAEHPVVQRGREFIVASARADGSWPIDTNLATWVTTLSVNALASGIGLRAGRREITDFLLRQQYRYEHPYTLAAPGGWAWTNLQGGVPDADDTAGAILALIELTDATTAHGEAIAAGVTWLLGLQNRDGGIPTFCRGWGRLPFDRSSPDITAHAVRAWSAAKASVSPELQSRIDRALARALHFLRSAQQRDGSWIPLWFGHQRHPREENPLYGTTRVVVALGQLPERLRTTIGDSLARGVCWLVTEQRADGGWTAAAGADSTIEETGLALEALAVAWPSAAVERPQLASALQRGTVWLCTAAEAQRWNDPSPIGLYFAKLWYHERLYPLIFSCGALTRLAALR